MKVLIINRYMDLENPADPCMMLCKDFISEGHEVTLVTSADTYSGRQRKSPLFSTSSVQEGIRIVLVHSRPFSEQDMGKPFYRSVKSFTRIYKRVIKKYVRQANLIIVYSTAPADIDKLADFKRAGKLKNKKLVYHISDLWPTTAVERYGRHIGEKFLTKMQYFEDVAFNNADFIVSELQYAGGYVFSRGYRVEGRFQYIPVGIDETRHLHLNTPGQAVVDLFVSLRQQGKFVVSAFDDPAEGEQIKCLIEALKTVPEPVHGVLVCKQENLEQYRTLAGDAKNITLFPFTDDNDLDNILRASDMVYFGEQYHTLQRFGSDCPGLFRAMLSGRPVLYAGDGSSSHVVTAKAGLAVSPSDPEAVKEALTAAPELPPEVMDLMGEAGRQYVIDNYGRGLRLKRYLELINREEDPLEKIKGNKVKGNYIAHRNKYESKYYLK